LKPELIFTLPGINPEGMEVFISNLVKERNYIHIDVTRLNELLIKRGVIGAE